MSYSFPKSPADARKRYERYLKAVSSMSPLFSDSNVPFLDYRLAEYLFCRCFGADNLARSCVAIDARIGDTGIGIKTFVYTPYQKIAEFDKERTFIDCGNVHKDVVCVSELRNKRLDLSKDTYGVKDLIYHYIVRTKNKLSIYECPMDYIDIENIEVTKSDDKGFDFTDGKNSYRFNRSKSTLLEQFSLEEPFAEFGVEFLEDSTEAVLRMYQQELHVDVQPEEPELVLPLFSVRRNGQRYVPLKSGLNQWNAAPRNPGRPCPRDANEVYIPYNIEYRRISAGFFPDRDTPFALKLPDGREISAKVCQADGKSIMSNPNSALGHWILRDVLHLRERQLATMDMLDDLGINAVRFTKHDDGSYSIDFDYIEP